MAEHGVAALPHVPSGERVRTGPADPSGAWDQDHPPSTATTTQESGLRENRTSRLSERTEEGRKPDLLRLYTPRTVGNRAHRDPSEGREASGAENRCRDTREGTLSPANLSTNRQRIAHLARSRPGVALTMAICGAPSTGESRTASFDG